MDDFARPHGEFKYKVGERVMWQGRRVRITARTIESALGKTYRIRLPNGRNQGFVPEERLTPLPKNSY